MPRCSPEQQAQLLVRMQQRALSPGRGEGRWGPWDLNQLATHATMESDSRAAALRAHRTMRAHGTDARFM